MHTLNPMSKKSAVNKDILMRIEFRTFNSIFHVPSSKLLQLHGMYKREFFSFFLRTTQNVLFFDSQHLH